MLDPSMLLFISLRYDVRIRGVLRYAHAAQKQAMSGCAKLAMAVETLQVLRACSAAAQGLLGAARAWQVLATFMDGCRWPRKEQATRAQRHAFIGTMAMEAAGKKLPTACNVLLELLFKRQIRGFRGLGMGLHEVHVFSEPGPKIRRVETMLSIAHNCAGPARSLSRPTYGGQNARTSSRKSHARCGDSLLTLQGLAGSREAFLQCSCATLVKRPLGPIAILYIYMFYTYIYTDRPPWYPPLSPKP